MPKIIFSILNNNKFTVLFKTNNNLLKLLRPNKRTLSEEKTGIYINECVMTVITLYWTDGNGFSKTFPRTYI